MGPAAPEPEVDRPRRLVGRVGQIDIEGLREGLEGAGRRRLQAMAQMQQQLQQVMIQLEQEKIASNERIKQLELKHKYYDTDADVAMKESELTGRGVIELEKERMRGNASIEQSRARSAEAGSAGNREVGEGN